MIVKSSFKISNDVLSKIKDDDESHIKYLIDQLNIGFANEIAKLEIPVTTTEDDYVTTITKEVVIIRKEDWDELLLLLNKASRGSPAFQYSLKSIFSWLDKKEKDARKE